MTEAQQLAAILDSFGFVVTSVAPDGTILFVNEVAARNLSGTREQLVGRSLYDFFSDAQGAAARSRVRQTVNKKETQHFEAMVTLPDGSERYFDSAYYPAIDDHGEVTCVQIVASDVTELRQAQKASSAVHSLWGSATDDLSLTAERVSAILDNAPIRITVLDPDMTIRYMNRVSSDVDMAEVIGSSPQQWLTEEGRRTMADAFTQVLSTKKVTECQVDSIFGNTFWIRLAPLIHRGEVRQVLNCGLDITEQRRLEAQLRNKQKMEGLGTLAGGIAHDFNNLLSAILGNAGLAQRAVERSGDPAPFLQNIKDTSHRAADLCEQLLTYAGREQFDLAPGDMNKVITEMARLTRAGVSTKIRVDYELQSDLPLIDCDATQLGQVVINLISNAAESIGDRHGSITLTTDCVDLDHVADEYLPTPLAAGRYVQLRVSDTGHGMPDDVRTRIFDPFYSTKSAGHGLGLSAVLGIVGAHHAGVAVDSRVAHGTTFSVLFPMHQGTVDGAGDAHTVHHWTGGSGTVLIVEDESSVREVATAVLIEAGYDVLQAADGQEALTILQHEDRPISAVLLDITMPRRDGHSTLKELRKTHKHLPVVMTSGKTREMRTTVPDPLVTYLRKPYSAEQLASAVANAVASPGGGDQANRPQR